MKIIILYSGGLDSFILKHLAEKEYPKAEIKCIYYAHGSEAEKAELHNLPNFVEVRKVDWLNDRLTAVSKKDDPFAGPAYVPGRNMVFAVLAASQELPDEIWMGTLWDEVNETATDKNEKFRKETSKLISYVLSPFKDYVNIKFPFHQKEWTKELAIKWAIENGLSKDELSQRISCWFPIGNIPCGICKNCFKTNLAFHLNDIFPVYYYGPFTHPNTRTLLLQYLDKYYESKDKMNVDELNVVSMINRSLHKFPEQLRNEIKLRYNQFENF